MIDWFTDVTIWGQIQPSLTLNRFEVNGCMNSFYAGFQVFLRFRPLFKILIILVWLVFLHFLIFKPRKIIWNIKHLHFVFTYLCVHLQFNRKSMNSFVNSCYLWQMWVTLFFLSFFLSPIYLKYTRNSNLRGIFQRKTILCTWKLYKWNIEQSNKIRAWQAVGIHLIHLSPYQIKTLLVFSWMDILLF